MSNVHDKSAGVIIQSAVLSWATHRDWTHFKDFSRIVLGLPLPLPFFFRFGTRTPKFPRKKSGWNSGLIKTYSPERPPQQGCKQFSGRGGVASAAPPRPFSQECKSSRVFWVVLLCWHEMLIVSKMKLFLSARARARAEGRDTCVFSVQNVPFHVRSMSGLSPL